MEQIKKLKKLGVIGGMGPKASSLYYDSVIDHTKADKDQEHIEMVLISHSTMPDRTEAILTGESDELIKLLRDDAKTLESLGADNIAVTCNTSHYYYRQMQEAVQIPIINMVSESIRYAVDSFKNVKRIGIMATDGTVNSHIYHDACAEAGITPEDLSEERQKGVMSLIYDDIKGGLPADEAKFNEAIAEFKEKKCDVVILACTELSVYKETHETPNFCLDAMEVLVRESILRSGAEYQ